MSNYTWKRTKTRRHQCNERPVVLKWKVTEHSSTLYVWPYVLVEFEPRYSSAPLLWKSVCIRLNDHNYQNCGQSKFSVSNPCLLTTKMAKSIGYVPGHWQGVSVSLYVIGLYAIGFLNPNNPWILSWHHTAICHHLIAEYGRRKSLAEKAIKAGSDKMRPPVTGQGIVIQIHHLYT